MRSEPSTSERTATGASESTGSQVPRAPATDVAFWSPNARRTESVGWLEYLGTELPVDGTSEGPQDPLPDTGGGGLGDAAVPAASPPPPKTPPKTPIELRASTDPSGWSNFSAPTDDLLPAR